MGQTFDLDRCGICESAQKQQIYSTEPAHRARSKESSVSSARGSSARVSSGRASSTAKHKSSLLLGFSSITDSDVAHGASPPSLGLAGFRRAACPKGTRCRRQRDPRHLAEEAHPFDPDYAQICETDGIEPEPPSLRGLFEWVDVDDSSKISVKELENAIPLLEKFFGEPIRLTEKSWQNLDEDGNGCVNFSEFAAWAGPRLGFPLGVEHLFHACSIQNCPCEKFEEKPKTKGISKGAKLCRCGHKSAAHSSVAALGKEVPFPSYWNVHDGEFSSFAHVDASTLAIFQKVIDDTYRNTYTRDRKRHNPDAPNVPKGYQVLRALRSENSKYWREYSVRREELSLTRAETSPGEEFVEYRDIKTMKAWKKFAGPSADRLRSECNEWYLLHGTSPQAAEKICKGDFKICLAGSSTGTLYGKGSYFSESITKADEYAKPNSEGERALILCRALGGRVRYTDELEPDPEDLTQSCIQGPYDCILGDREKCKKTFREFVFYDTENVYAEYVIYYKRLC